MQVLPFQRLLMSAVRAWDVIPPLVALFPFSLDSALAFERRRRSEHDLPIPETDRALRSKRDLVALITRALDPTVAPSYGVPGDE